MIEDYPYSSVEIDFKKSKVDSKYGFGFSYDEINELIKLDTGAIGIVDVLDSPTFSYKYLGSRKVTFTPEKELYAGTPTIYRMDEVLNGNEIIISKILADEMVRFYSSFGITSNDLLIGETFDAFFANFFNGEVVIKKIIDYIALMC